MPNTPQPKLHSEHPKPMWPHLKEARMAVWGRFSRSQSSAFGLPKCVIREDQLSVGGIRSMLQHQIEEWWTDYWNYWVLNRKQHRFRKEYCIALFHQRGWLPDSRFRSGDAEHWCRTPSSPLRQPGSTLRWVRRIVEAAEWW